MKKEGKILILFCMIFAAGLVCAIPQSFNVQGKLTDSLGSPLSGDYSMNYSIYDSYTGGNLLWNSGAQTVSVDEGGIYNIILNGIDLSFSTQYFLGIKVESDAEMTPRINLTSSPYSFRSNVTDFLDSLRNYTVSSLFATGNIGIGTSSPMSKLHVIGNINATGSIYVNGSQEVCTAENGLCENGSSGTLDGYDSSFFMPLNTSVFGDFDFNGGWESGGLSIKDGDIYAQTGWFYNISSLSITHLEVNGSLFPDLDNQFDFGNSSFRWRDLHIGNNGYFGGKIGIGTNSPGEKLEVNGNILADNFNAVSSNLTAVGLDAAGSNSGSSVTATGYRAGYQNTGSSLTATGYLAGYQNTGDATTATGYYAGRENTGIYLTATGYLAGYQNTGATVTATGYYAGSQNNGSSLTATGYLAGYQNTGDATTATGYYAGRENTGSSLTATGYLAGYQNTGATVTATGYYAGYQNTGSSLTATGYLAGRYNSGIRTSGFGREALYNNSGNDVVAIGYQAGRDNSVANQFIVKQANVNAIPLIQGDFSSGNVGIGTTNPNATLHVAGDINVTSGNDICIDGGNCLSAMSGGVWSTSGSDVYYNSGNVGIGTNSPQSRIHIMDNGSVSSGIRFGSSNTAIYQSSINENININIGTGTSKWYFSSGSSGSSLVGGPKFNRVVSSNIVPTLLPGSDDDTGIGGGGNNLSLIVGGASGVFIEEGGNVGIGTTSPSEKLDVNGTLQLGEGKIRFNDTTKKYNYYNGSIWQELGTGSGGGGYWTQNGTEIYYNSGNVRVGDNGLVINSSAIVSSGALQIGKSGALLTLPSSQGTDGQILTTDGSGNLSWSDSLVSYTTYSLDYGSWSNTGSTLPANLAYSQTAVIGDYVYLFGGYNGASVVNTIYRAPVSDPTSWSNTGSTLPGNLISSQTAVIGDYVYLFGGYNGASVVNTIYRAPVSDPTSWSNTGSTLPGVLGYSQTAVIGDYVYLFGGSSGSITNVIYRAPVSDPTNWSNTGSTLPGTLQLSRVAVIGDYVYLFGGHTGGSYTNVIYRAPVSDPTDWSNTGSILPSNLGYSQSAVIGDYVYLFGGYNGASYTNVIYRAPVSDPTSWSNTGSTLPSVLAYSQTAVIGDYLYLFGGYTSAYTNIIYRAPIISTISSSTTITDHGEMAISKAWKYSPNERTLGLNKYFVQNGSSFGELATIGTDDAYDFVLETSDTERMRIDTSGNVGIGTASPGEKLEVNGSINATGDICITGGNCLSNVSGGGGSGGWTDDGSDVHLANSSDSVGIGTDSPTAKLEVWGDVNIYLG